MWVHEQCGMMAGLQLHLVTGTVLLECVIPTYSAATLYRTWYAVSDVSYCLTSSKSLPNSFTVSKLSNASTALPAQQQHRQAESYGQVCDGWLGCGQQGRQQGQD